MSLVKRIQDYTPAVDPNEWKRERESMLSQLEAQKTAEARQWLEHRGIHKPRMTRKEKTEANRAYLRKLKTMAKPEPHAWAYEIISLIADGEIVTHHAEAMAREVTGISKDEKEAA